MASWNSWSASSRSASALSPHLTSSAAVYSLELVRTKPKSMSCGKGSPRDRYVSRHLSKTRRSVSLLGNVPGLLAAWLVSPATDDLSSVATDEDTLGSGVAVEAPAPLLASPKKKSVASPNSVLACSARTNGNPPPGGSGMLRFGFSSEPRPWLLLLLRDFCRTLAAAPAGMYATRGRPDRIRVWGVWGGVLVRYFLIKTCQFSSKTPNSNAVSAHFHPNARFFRAFGVQS